MLTAEEAIGRLREGNGRFVDGGRLLKDLTSPERRSEVSGVQNPFAIVLGCADARVPAEIVFDHGLGDLFVIRVAGNVVAPSGVGSVEFAAERFGTRLVVVLGHSRCGAGTGHFRPRLAAGLPHQAMEGLRERRGSTGRAQRLASIGALGCRVRPRPRYLR